MELEKKINEIEQKMSGLKELVKKYNFGFYDIYMYFSPADIKYTETEKFKVAAVKWHCDTWSDCGGGTEWREDIRVYYKTHSDEAIYTKKPLEIVTRDMHHPRKDKTWLWEYKFVDLKKLSESTVEVSLMDDKGDKKMTQQVYLDMKKD